MKPLLAVSLVLGCLLGAAPVLCAQDNSKGASQGNGAGQDSKSAAGQNGSQSKAGDDSQGAPAQAPSRVNSQSNSNPFPEDEDSVPVVPTASAPVLPPGATESRIPLPEADLDPVRTPEEAGAAAESNETNSSSSLAGMSDLLPPADDNAQPGKHGKNGKDIEPDHQESAKEDENVGNYYLDNKDYKGALSRYESASVLDPYNPDVYWGLAECERHLGKFADARANYLKVMAYDPGSHHAKDARKALEDPQIANAKPQLPAPSSTHPQ